MSISWLKLRRERELNSTLGKIPRWTALDKDTGEARPLN